MAKASVNKRKRDLSPSSKDSDNNKRSNVNGVPSSPAHFQKTKVTLQLIPDYCYCLVDWLTITVICSAPSRDHHTLLAVLNICMKPFLSRSCLNCSNTLSWGRVSSPSQGSPSSVLNCRPHLDFLSLLYTISLSFFFPHSWCRLHHQHRLRGVTVTILEDVTQVHFYRYYPQFRNLRRRYKTVRCLIPVIFWVSY